VGGRGGAHLNPPLLPLETARLRLVAYAPSAEAAVQALPVLLDAGVPEIVRSSERSAAVRAWIASAALGTDEIGIGHGAVVLAASGEPIGDAGIRLVRDEDGGASFVLALALVPAQRRRGFGLELARALLTAAFGPLRLSEIHAFVPVEAAAARALAERAGFRATRQSGGRPGPDGATILRYVAHAPPARVRPRIKMCGMTSPYDAELAVAAGADAIGLIFAPSARRVTLEEAREVVRALPALTERVAVFADAPGDEVRRICEALGALPQFSGSESDAYVQSFGGERCLRVVRVARAASGASLAAAVVPDARVLPVFETLAADRAGGSGTTFDWSLVAQAAKWGRVGVSGGLTPENVAECVRVARPYAVDVRSGIERGEAKDARRMQAFVAAVRGTRDPSA